MPPGAGAGRLALPGSVVLLPGGCGADVQILTVEQITGYIKEVLASDVLLADVWLRGEVSNLSRPASGHIYFTLKDAGTQLKCVLFRHHARHQPFLPCNGDAVIVHGRVSLYEASGTLQLYADLVQPEGVGAAFLQFERLRQRLAEEGLFDESRKRRLPTFPRCIGVVTSASGAVWHDIITIIGRRYPVVEIILAPALVQGDEAPASIVAALRRLWLLERCDLIIVGRGGGSAEDLAAFNDEAVARAIYASPVPIISAVGHEVDITIADFVADLRAPTPSAAAELAVPDRMQLLAELGGLRRRLGLAMTSQLAASREEVEHACRHLQRVSPRVRVQTERQRLDDALKAMAMLLRHRLALHQSEVAAAAAQLAALDPRAVLARGYAVVTLADDETVVASATGVLAGDRLRVRVQDGEFGALVEPAGAGEAR